MLGAWGDHLEDEAVATASSSPAEVEVPAGASYEVWIEGEVENLVLVLDDGGRLAVDTECDGCLQRWGAERVSVVALADAVVAIEYRGDGTVHVAEVGVLDTPFRSEVPWAEILLSATMAGLGFWTVWRRLRKLLAD